MSELQNLRAFKVTFLSPTTHRGARVKIVDVMTRRYKDVNESWSKMRHTIVLPYSHRIGSIEDQAIEHMKSVGLSVVAMTQIADDEHIILSDSWSDGPRSRFLDLDGKTLDDHQKEVLESINW